MSRRCHPRRPRPSGSAGMTILEVLVAVLIASSAIALIVPTFIRQLGISSEASSLSSVESVVSRDLGWISDYARWWKLRSGPYNLSTAITRTSSWSTTPEAVYEPPADRCADGTLASAFLDDLASVTTNPPRPYPIPTSSAPTTLASLDGLEIQRTITTHGSTLQLVYSVSGSKAASLRFWRQASLLIEAAAWCERLP